jgi:hypothetical protein
MTVMKQAIVGHEDEKFLSDDPKAGMDVAKAAPAPGTAAGPNAATAVNAVPNANGVKPVVKPAAAQPAKKKLPPVVTPAQANKLDSILN